MEATRRHAQTPQDRPQRHILAGTIHGAQDPDRGASVGQTLVGPLESRACGRAVVGMGMIIDRSLMPLNSSRTMGSVRRRDDNSRGKVQNVREGSSVDSRRAICSAGLSERLMAVDPFSDARPPGAPLRRTSILSERDCFVLRALDEVALPLDLLVEDEFRGVGGDVSGR
jgi:hypothetical protein